MGYRALDVNVISAKDLKDVNRITTMDVYAVVAVTGDSNFQMAKTPVNLNGGCNPTWNFPVKFSVDDSLAHQNRLSLVFKLKSERALGDKDIGEVIVPVKELLDSPGDGKSPQSVGYQVRISSGKTKGLLHFSYKFGDVVSAAAAGFASVKADEPVTAYPATVAGSSSVPYNASAAEPYPPSPAAGYPYPPSQEKVGYPYPPPQQNGGYPPPPQGFGYPQPPLGYPPQGGYGFPPQGGYGYPPQGGYGYPPMQQQPPKKNKFGMGMGTGLLGGMLGGLIIGDMVSDAVDCDVNDMDMGGFDF